MPEIVRRVNRKNYRDREARCPFVWLMLVHRPYKWFYTWELGSLLPNPLFKKTEKTQSQNVIESIDLLTGSVRKYLMPGENISKLYKLKKNIWIGWWNVKKRENIEKKQQSKKVDIISNI